MNFADYLFLSILGGTVFSFFFVRFSTSIPWVAALALTANAIAQIWDSRKNRYFPIICISEILSNTALYLLLHSSVHPLVIGVGFGFFLLSRYLKRKGK